MAAKLLQTLAPQIAAASSMASSSAVACRVASRLSAVSMAAPSSVSSLHALRASDEVLVAICRHLAAAARRAGLHAAAAPEVTHLPLCLPLPLEPDVSDPTAPRLDPASASASASATGTGGEDSASFSTPAPSSYFLLVLQATEWTRGVLGSNFLLCRPRLDPASASASASATGTGGEDSASSSTPAPSSYSLLVLQATEWTRGVLGSNFLLCSGVSSAISSASDAPSGLLLLDPPSSTRWVRPPTAAGVNQILVRRDVCSTPHCLSSGPSTRRFYSVSCSPPKGPHPPALRDARFLVALMDGMVLSHSDLIYL
ncbi:unnamed protein product [Urochloa humidicola]